jgi:paraquat-inducible protein B
MPKKILMLLMLLLVFWGCEEKVLNFRIKYDQTQGLEAADRVIFQQNHIGQVAGIFYGEDGYYLVDVAIRKAFANAATEDSMFFITEDPKNKGKKAIEIIQARKGGVPLEDGTIVEGSSKPSAVFSQLGQSLAEQLEGIKKAFEHLSEELTGVPESEEFKKLERELERLGEEMKRSGESVREKMEQEWLPQLQQEIERLRKRLQKLGREDEVKDLEIQLEKIRET